MIVRTLFLSVFVMVRDKEEEEGIHCIVIHVNELYGCCFEKLMVREANFIE